MGDTTTNFDSTGNFFIFLLNMKVIFFPYLCLNFFKFYIEIITNGLIYILEISAYMGGASQNI